MAFIETPQAARVAIRYDMYGEDMVNTLWFYSTAGNFEVTDLFNLCSLVNDWAIAAVLPELSEDVTLMDITAIAQDTNTSPSYVFVNGISVGGLASPGSVSQTCLKIKFNTANRGRSGRGGNYVGGFPASAWVADVLNATRFTNIQAGYGTLPAFVTPFNHVVVSHQHDGVALSEGLVQGVISYQAVNDDADVIRKRGKGRGS